MKKNKPKTMGKNIDRDVELCRTTNARVSSQMMRTLVSHEIPFTQNWVRVPFYKRVAYNGAKEVCVISTHYNQYQRARRVLDHDLRRCKRRLIGISQGRRIKHISG